MKGKIERKRPILWSICICTLKSRNKNLTDLLNNLEEQIKDYHDIEILWFGDNKKRNVGQKRNSLVSIANGKYISFIDDDDKVSNDYVKLIYERIIKSFPDVVVFDHSVSLNGEKPMIAKFSKDFGFDYNYDDYYQRLPNHIMVIKKEIHTKIKTPELRKGSDFIFAREILPYLKTEERIDKVLYYYNFFEDKSECFNEIEN